jgi:hypothetical protein
MTQIISTILYKTYIEIAKAYIDGKRSDGRMKCKKVIKSYEIRTTELKEQTLCYSNFFRTSPLSILLAASRPARTASLGHLSGA